MAGATSRWASSPTASPCSTPRKGASTGSGAVASAGRARCVANATSPWTSRRRGLLRAERRHELVEVLPGRADGLLAASHLEEVLAVAGVDDRAEQHVIRLRRCGLAHHAAGRELALDL